MTNRLQNKKWKRSARSCDSGRPWSVHWSMDVIFILTIFFLEIKKIEETYVKIVGAYWIFRSVFGVAVGPVMEGVRLANRRRTISPLMNEFRFSADAFPSFPHCLLIRNVEESLLFDSRRLVSFTFLNEWYFRPLEHLFAYLTGGAVCT